MSTNYDDDKPHSTVGYGKPPVEHQFKQGESGNPNGRPRKDRSSAQNAVSIELTASERVRRELGERIQVNDNGVIKELTKEEVMIKQLTKGAIGGNRHDAKLLLEIRDRDKKNPITDTVEIIEAIESYKAHHGPNFDRAKRRGKPEPDYHPHPLDVFFDYEAGRAECQGPLNPAQRITLNDCLRLRLDIGHEIKQLAEEFAEAADADERDDIIEAWHDLQLRFDLINDRAPARCRKRLPNRSDREGASRAGETLRGFGKALASRRKTRVEVPPKIQSVLTSVRQGMTRRKSCRQHGVNRSEFNHSCESHPAIRVYLQEALSDRYRAIVKACSEFVTSPAPISLTERLVAEKRFRATTSIRGYEEPLTLSEMYQGGFKDESDGLY